MARYVKQKAWMGISVNDWLPENDACPPDSNICLAENILGDGNAIDPRLLKLAMKQSACAYACAVLFRDKPTNSQRRAAIEKAVKQAQKLISVLDGLDNEAKTLLDTFLPSSLPELPTKFILALGTVRLFERAANDAAQSMAIKRGRPTEIDPEYEAVSLLAELLSDIPNVKLSVDRLAKVSDLTFGRVAQGQNWEGVSRDVWLGTNREIP